MVKTKSLLLITSFALASIATTPMYAQLRGTLDSTLGTTTRANGNGSGMRGDLGLNQTLNGSLSRGDQSLATDAASNVNVVSDASRKGTKEKPDVSPVVSGVAAKTNAEMSAASTTAVSADGEATAASAAKLQPAKQKATNLLTSAQASSSGQASTQTGAQTSADNKSASSEVSASKTVGADLGDNHVSTRADANANSQATVHRQEKGEHSHAAVNNSNSGSAKLHGLDRAETRVKNDTAVDAIEQNEDRQASAAVVSKTNASVKASHKPKR